MEKYLDVVKRMRRFYTSRKTNSKIKSFVKKKDPSVNYTKNFWSRNNSWDYYYQRHNENEKSSHYVPYDYFVFNIQPKLNNAKHFLYVEDKQMYDRLYGNLNVLMPKTIFRCNEGIFMDEEYNRISDIQNFLNQTNQNLFLKKTNGSHGGLGIEKYISKDGWFYDLKNNEKLDIQKLYKRYKGNFIVQECHEQHDALENLHQNSLNSLRVDSYRSVKTNEVHILMASIRMGRNGSFIDNVSSGGMAVGIKIDDNNEAMLREFSFKPFSNSRITSHPDSNIIFKDYKIPGFPNVVAAIKKLSNVVPAYRLIAWDFSIDKEGNAVMIELNSTGAIWGSQENNGTPFFGKFSEEVRDFVKNGNN